MDKTLEFDIILNQIKQYAKSQMAKDYFANLNSGFDFEDLQDIHNQNIQMLDLILKFGQVPLGYYEDISLLLKKVDKGGTLSGLEFLEIMAQLKNVKEIEDYREDIDTLGVLEDLFDSLIYPGGLVAMIEKCIDSDGSVLDGASSELRRVRHEIISLQGSMRSKIAGLKNHYKDYLSQETYSSRNDHLVLPVKAGHKNSVAGIVHAISGSGQTVYIEPSAIVAISNQITAAKETEQLEIQKILQMLSNEVNKYLDVLKYNQEGLIEIEILNAKNNYGLTINATIPNVTRSFDEFKLLKAAHPLIKQSEVVANDIVLTSDHQTLLISGSNTGGKSVVLKTAGLLAKMALAGLPVSASFAVVPYFDNIFVDLGDEQSIEQSLSTFSSHMTRLTKITNQATRESLVLLDEIGSGTDPQEGQALAQAILEYLHEKQAMVIATTHYSKLKEYAKNSEYIQVASVEFDHEELKPTYRLLMGSTGNSYAIEISKRLGLHPDIISKSTQIKQTNQTQSEQLLEMLEKQLIEVQDEKDRIAALKKEAERKESELQRKLDRLQNEKEKLIEQAKEDANKILEAAKSQVEEVVASLQQQATLKPHQVIEAKRTLDVLKHQKEAEAIVPSDHEYVIGDVVLVKSVKREGEVVAINKKGILTISLGGLKLNAKPHEVVFKHAPLKPKTVVTGGKSVKTQSTMTYELNIIGKRYVEAMEEVDKFLDTALVNNYSVCRIVHGMGSGVLRKGVHQLLKSKKYVKSFRDGGPNEGGLGATLVYFD